MSLAPYRQPVEESGAIVPNGGINQADSPTSLKPNEWASAFDVEPMQDGVRRRNGTSIENPIAAGSSTTENTTGTDEFQFDSQNYEFSQGFELSGASAVASVLVKLKKGTGDAGTIKVAVYSDAAGEPDAAVAGMDFTDFSQISVADLPESADWITFSLPVAVSLSGSTQYHIVVLASNTVDTRPSLIGDDGGNPYADGTVHARKTDGNWQEGALDDLLFKVPTDAVPITGIFQYKQTNASIERHVLTTNQAVYKIASGVLTSLGSFDSDTGINVFPSGAVAGDRLFLANGTDLPQYYYDDDITPRFANEGISKPDDDITPVPLAGGTLDFAEDWQVDYKYWDNDLGRESNSQYSADLSEAPSVTLSSGNQTIRISSGDLPTAVERTGDYATHIRVYIKQTSDAEFRYSGTQVLLSSLPANVDITDDVRAQVDEYDHAVPPIHSIKLAIGSRQFIAGIDGDATAIQWSRIEGIDSDVDSYPLGNYRRVGDVEGDRITSLSFVPPYTLVIGLKNSVYALDARDPGFSAEVLLAQGVGVAHHKAFTVIGRSLFFLSDAEETKGPMLWEGTRVRPLTQLDDTFAEDINLSRLQYASCAHLAPGDNRFQWWSLVSSLGSNSHDRILVYDYRLDAWSIHRLSGNVLGQFADSSRSEIYIGGTGGYEYKTDDGSTDAGASIEGVVQLMPYDFGTTMHKKLLRGLDYIVVPQATGDIGLTIEKDFGALDPAAVTIPQRAESGDVLGTGVLGQFILGGGLGPSLAGTSRLRHSARYFQPSFYSQHPFHIQELNWHVQMLGRK